MKGCHYLWLKNADKLTESQSEKFDRLLAENSNMNTLYVMKEQLQAFWSNTGTDNGVTTGTMVSIGRLDPYDLYKALCQITQKT